jgi:hypothetical protein
LRWCTGAPGKKKKMKKKKKKKKKKNRYCLGLSSKCQWVRRWVRGPEDARMGYPLKAPD